MANSPAGCYNVCMLRFALILALASVSCSGVFSSRDSSALRMQLGSEPVSLTPWLSEDGLSMKVLGNTWHGLVGLGVHGELEPRLADRWEFNPSKRLLRFHIRSGAKWSDGEAVTAQQFSDGLEHALSPQTGAKVAGLLEGIKGAELYRSDKAAWSQVGVRVQGEWLEIELERWMPQWSQALALLVASPYRKALAAGGAWRNTNPSTGPYFIESHEPQRRLRLRANPHFWGTAPKTPVVDLIVVADENTGMHLFERGELDIVGKAPAHEIGRLEKAGKARVYRDPFLATYYLAFKVKNPQVSDPTLRRALASAIQKEQLVQALGTGETPAWSWIPPLLLNEAPPASQARLAPTKKWDGKQLEIMTDSSARNSLVLEKVQNDWQLALGVRLKIFPRDWKTHVRELSSQSAPLYRFGWLSPLFDPLPHLKVFTSQSPNNYTGWKNPRYDTIVSKVEALAPGAERTRLIREAEKILLLDEAVTIPLYHYVQIHLVSPAWSGFRADPMGVVRLDELARVGK